MIDLFFTIEGLVFYFLVLPFLMYLLLMILGYGINKFSNTVRKLIYLIIKNLN